MNLTGWLIVYLSGYSRGDITIGNIIMTKQLVKRKSFKTPDEFLEHLSSLEDES